MSGYNKSRFVDLSATDFDELMCGICFGVFRDPIETNCCRKTFCTNCIEDWIKRENTCPNDRKPLYRNDLIGSSKIVLNLLAKLQIKCEFSDTGCPKVVSLESLAKHMDECNYNKCKNCGEGIGNPNDHNCEQNLKKRVNELRSSNEVLNRKAQQMSTRVAKLEAILRKHNIIVCYKCGEEGHMATQCVGKSAIAHNPQNTGAIGGHVASGGSQSSAGRGKPHHKAGKAGRGGGRGGRDQSRDRPNKNEPLIQFDSLI